MRRSGRFVFIFCIFALFFGSARSAGFGGGGAKYVFFFIGDGMSWSQVHATEIYLAAREGDNGFESGQKVRRLNFTSLPFTGIQTSFANNRLITDSAAAGTALACGMKTNVGVVSMSPDGQVKYRSIAEAAKDRGMRVGIVSSVSIDHATPAVFYAHSISRNHYKQIGEQLLASGFDYFAGGGFRADTYTEQAGMSIAERYGLIEKAAVKKGFIYADTRAEFEALKSGPAIVVNPYLDEGGAIPYEINRIYGKARYEGSISLAEFTKKGIELLDNPKGFFMMVEGGKIDWACHANDAAAAIGDVIALDDAVKAAVEFAEKRPGQTLIVVTGDHECGGMSLGSSGTGYESFYERLGGQRIAYDDFNRHVLSGYRARHSAAAQDIDREMWGIIYEYFGMDGAGITAEQDDDLSEFEKRLIEDAYDKSMHGKSVKGREEDWLLYGKYEPLTVALTHLLNRKAGLSWTSFSHTAAPIAVFASGKNASLFAGYYDNTDIARKMGKAMKIDLMPDK